MARVLVTGMSGSGKSTVVAALIARGITAVDTDDGYVLPAPGGLQQWDIAAIGSLLDAHGDLVIAGCEENMSELRARFDHIVLLTAPLSVLLGRIETRVGNDFGKSPAERARIIADVEQVEPLLRRIATEVIDATEPPDLVVSRIAALVG